MVVILGCYVGLWEGIGGIEWGGMRNLEFGLIMRLVSLFFVLCLCEGRS